MRMILLFNLKRSTPTLVHILRILMHHLCMFVMFEGLKHLQMVQKGIPPGEKHGRAQAENQEGQVLRHTQRQRLSDPWPLGDYKLHQNHKHEGLSALSPQPLRAETYRSVW